MTYKSSDVKSNGATTAKNGKARNALNERSNFNKSKRVEAKSKLEKPLRSKCTKRNGANHIYAESNKVFRNSNKDQETTACNEKVGESPSIEEKDKVNALSNKDFRFKEPITEVSEVKSKCERASIDRSIQSSTSLKIQLDDMFSNSMQKTSITSVSDDDSLSSSSCVSVSPLISRRSSTLSSSTRTSSGTIELGGCQTKHNNWNQPRQAHRDGAAFDNRLGLAVGGSSHMTLLQLEDSYEQKLQTLTKELMSICQNQESDMTTTLNSISESEITWPLVTNCCGDALIER